MKPTEKGFYWHKPSKFDNWEPVEIVYTSKLKQLNIGSDEYVDLEDLTGEWVEIIPPENSNEQT